MHSIIDFFQNLSNAEWIMQNGGLYVVILIIFAETGLFVGFFLPGDYLLFIAGMVVARAPQPFSFPLVNLFYWSALIIVAAIVGNIVGYIIGKRSGNYLMNKKDTWLFKKRHIEQAHEFYEKRGGMAIILARFLPIIRTFAPVVAGMVKMEFGKFVLFSIIGAIVWVFSLMSLGYALGNNEWVKSNLEFIVIGLVVITTLPIVFKLISSKILNKKVKDNDPL